MAIKYIYGKNNEVIAVEITMEQWKSIEKFIGEDADHIISSSLTTDGQKDSIQDIKPISLTIEKCQAGWIPIIFSSPTSWVKIFASDCFDPFQDIINWLCKIINLDLPAIITIAEEGTSKTLRAEKANNIYVKFLIVDFDYDEGMTPDPIEDDLEYPRTYIKTFIDPDMLINEMLFALKSFFSEPENYSQWRTFGSKQFHLNFKTLEDLLSNRKGVLH
ncbi:MAG: hypothetical protein KKE73_01630 [Proteobacteria bacterium]|nr:hypothetical protein [Pseudomonadota bacterium]